MELCFTVIVCNLIYCVFVPPHPDGQEEARTHQEQARPEERQETTKEINDDELFWEKTNENAKKKPWTTNEEEHRGRLSGTWSQALPIRAPPCVEEAEVSYLASSRTVVCFILRIFVWLFFFLLVLFFSVFAFVFVFFTLYLNVWRGIGLLYLVFRRRLIFNFFFCGTLINCLSVRGERGGRGEMRED